MSHAFPVLVLNLVYSNGSGNGHSMTDSPRAKVTRVNEEPSRWYVAVNNPADDVLHATVSVNMPLPGLALAMSDNYDVALELAPRELRILT